MCFIFKCCCGLSCDCLEPAEDWNITNDIREGEYGAGWLYKRGKSHGVWGKRFFVIKEAKLLYYADETRKVVKGEFSLANITCRISPTRANGNKKYHFVINHPETGTREFYAKNNVRRSQWIDTLNNTAAMITSSATGILLKQGGFGKSSWQERYCVCAGRDFDYFENMTDTSPKGNISMTNAKIREFTLKDQKYCFEIISAGGKKGSKKYSFSCQDETTRKKWMKQLKLATQYTPQQLVKANSNGGVDPTPVISPLQSEGNSSSGLFGKKSSKTPPEKRGYMLKKSPSLFTGYQKRFFVLCAPGDLRYYETEEDCNRDHGMKGVVQIAEILPDATGIQVLGPKLPNEFIIRVSGSKSYQMQCESPAEAQEWVDAIGAWLMHVSSSD